MTTDTAGTDAMTETDEVLSEARLREEVQRIERAVHEDGGDGRGEDVLMYAREIVALRELLAARTSTAPVAWQWSREGANGTEWVVVHDQAMATACQQLFDNKGTGQKVQALFAAPPTPANHIADVGKLVPPQPGVRVTPLVWSEVMPPDAECSYTHCHAETPFGRIVLDWKGWKEHPSFSAVLGNEFIDAAIAASTVEEAQTMIGKWWQDKVSAALAASIPQGEGERTRTIEDIAQRADKCAAIYGEHSNAMNRGSASALRQFAHDIRALAEPGRGR